jgi:hypothetical protein
MWDKLLNYTGYLIPIIGLLGGTVVAVVAIIATHWRHVRQAEADTALKQDLLQRGMSVEEIERVVRASSTASTEPAKEPISDNEYYMVEKLVEEGKTVDEIERIIRAFKGGTTASIVRANMAAEPHPRPERAQV